MKRGIIAATLLALSCGTAFAQSPDNDEGAYIGLGYGQWGIGIDDVDQTDEAIERIDDEDNAWKIFAGWRINPYFAFELNYVDFGNPGDRFEGSGSSGRYNLDLSGIQPAVVGSFPLGPVELFGKLGYYFIDVKLDVDTGIGDRDDFLDSDTSEEALSYGFGAGITFFERLHARLEYEKIDLDNVDDFDAIWASGSWRF